MAVKIIFFLRLYSLFDRRLASKTIVVDAKYQQHYKDHQEQDHDNEDCVDHIRVLSVQEALNTYGVSIVGSCGIVCWDLSTATCFLLRCLTIKYVCISAQVRYAQGVSLIVKYHIVIFHERGAQNDEILACWHQSNRAVIQVIVSNILIGSINQVGTW